MKVVIAGTYVTSRITAPTGGPAARFERLGRRVTLDVDPLGCLRRKYCNKHELRTAVVHAVQV